MFSKFDRSKLNLLPLACRENDLTLEVIRLLEPSEQIDPDLYRVAKAIVEARSRGASVILMMGAHVIRSGVQPFLIDMIEKGYISCIATNGAAAIHDYEFSMIGETTESVARYINEGQFGLWKETGELNTLIRDNAHTGQGAG